MIIVALAFALASAPAASAPAKNSAPADIPAALSAAATDFYTRYKKLPDGGGIPDDKARAILTPALSPALDKLLADGDAAEALYAKKTKNDSPPLVEGDPFTSNFEGATSFAVGACTGDAQRGTCAILLTYDESKVKQTAPALAQQAAKRKSKPITWTDTAAFVPGKAGWLLDDIAYGATWAFGNKGRLSDLLKEAVKESQKNYDE